MQSLRILSIIESAVQIVFGLEFVLIESFIKENEEFVFDDIIHG